MYTGITNDILSRVAKHNSGKGAKYCRSRLPVTCVYKKDMEDRSSALKEEYRIKQLTKKKKLELVYGRTE